MSDESLARVLVGMQLDSSVLGECERVLVSGDLSKALRRIFEEQALDTGVFTPKATGQLFFRRMLVVESGDLAEMEYAFVR